MEPLDTNVPGESDAFDRCGTQIERTIGNLASAGGRRERPWGGSASVAWLVG